MGFGVDYEKASSGDGIMPDGDYEVIIKQALEDVSKSGTQYINIPLIVRNDVEQQYKNAYIWHMVWKVKEPKEADKSSDGYSSWGIQTLSKAAGLPNGKKYKNLQEWCEDLKGKLLRVTVKNEPYNGNPQIKVKSMAVSKFPTCNHVYKTAVTGGTAMREPGEEPDELPF